MKMSKPARNSSRQRSQPNPTDKTHPNWVLDVRAQAR